MQLDLIAGASYGMTSNQFLLEKVNIKNLLSLILLQHLFIRWDFKLNQFPFKEPKAPMNKGRFCIILLLICSLLAGGLDLSRTQLKVQWLPLTEILRNFFFHGNRFFFIKFIEGSFQYPQLLIAHNTTHTFLYR